MPASLRRLVDLPTKPVYGGPDFDQYMGDAEVGRWSVPAVVTAEQATEARGMIVALDAHLAPAERQRTLARVMALLAHYYVAELPAQVQQALAEDWAEDVGEFPAWALDEACRTWRRANPRRKPTPGEIRDLCRREVATHRRQRDRLRQIVDAYDRGEVGAANDGQAAEWRRPSREEVETVGDIVRRMFGGADAAE